jgi:hypothetical protein
MMVVLKLNEVEYRRLIVPHQRRARKHASGPEKGRSLTRAVLFGKLSRKKKRGSSLKS